jgi:hypothetical protein
LKCANKRRKNKDKKCAKKRKSNAENVQKQRIKMIG